jgi:hypothetical protein
LQLGILLSCQAFLAICQTRKWFTSHGSLSSYWNSHQWTTIDIMARMISKWDFPKFLASKFGVFFRQFFIEVVMFQILKISE